MEEQALWERIPRLDGRVFDPAALVSAVNSLYAQGEERGAAVVRGWARMVDHCAAPDQNGSTAFERLHLVIRLMWRPDPPHQAWPIIPMGRPDISLPPPDTQWPMSPLVVSDEWPFLLVGGYRVGGALSAALPTIERLLDMAHWGGRPLCPLQDAVAAADMLVASVPWQSRIPSFQREMVELMVREQARRAMVGAGSP
jgi:hypothetical protein